MRFSALQTPEPKAFQFSREKLREAVHYVCANTPRAALGNVKLHKILYFADMFQYLQSGHPITGVEYVKQKFGPTARHLAATIRSLSEDRVLQVQEEDYYGYIKKSYLCLEDFVQRTLSNDELRLFDHFIDYVSQMSANEVTEVSHDAAWESVPLGHVIPYTSVFRVFAPEILEEDIAWGSDTARKHAAAN